MSSNAAGFLAPGRSRFDRVEAQSLPKGGRSTKKGSHLNPLPDPTALPSLPLARASLPAGEIGRGGHRSRLSWESGRETVRKAPGEGGFARDMTAALKKLAHVSSANGAVSF